MSGGFLDGFRALDLTDEKGFICGKVLASLGVDVIKVEKPGGDSARMIPPFYHDLPDPEKSLYWNAFNTDKRGITLNLETNKGRSLFKRLTEKADFIIESFTPGYMESLGLGYGALSQINPRIIITSITPFGQKGPYAKYKSSELIASAMGGIMDTNGDRDRAPIREGPDSIYYQTGIAAALGTVFAHYSRESTGEGQQVDISLHDITANRLGMNLVIWQFDKRLLKRSGPVRKAGARFIRQFWPCKDGYVMWILAGARWGAAGNRALAKWLDDEGIESPLGQVKNWQELDLAEVSQEKIEEFQSVIAEKLFMKHTKQEIYDESLKRGVDAVVVNSPADVLNNAQLKARDYWTELTDPQLGTSLKYPKHFFLCDQMENFIKDQAPHIGQNNDEIFVKELGLSTEEITSLRKDNII